VTLFADRAGAVGRLSQDRLVGIAQNYLPGHTFSPDYLYSKIIAAEAHAGHALRVFLEPVEVFPEGTPQADIDAWVLANPDKRHVEEPGYDWDPEFFRGNQWGFFEVRHRPIIAITSVQFMYPSTDQSLYEFPIQWIRMDKKYGHVRIVPTGNATSLPLNAWLLSVYGGGRMMPHMLRIRYTSGLKDARADYPDLIDLIYQVAAVGILEDVQVPSSTSISADGLSQSNSVDVMKLREGVDKKMDDLRRAIHGVSMAFL
jgi:hypothetical protein